MLDFGWKKKVERLRMVLLSGGHQLAKELPPGLVQIFESFRRAAKTGDGRHLAADMDRINREHADDPRPLWEPIEVYGWKIEATFYLENGQLWWLLHASRRNALEPSAKDIAALDKVLELLGADPKRDVILGPRSSPAGEPALPVGLYTWFNTQKLFEIQINKHKKKDKEKIRIVSLGAMETDGYQSVDKPGKDDGAP